MVGMMSIGLAACGGASQSAQAPAAAESTAAASSESKETKEEAPKAEESAKEETAAAETTEAPAAEEQAAHVDDGEPIKIGVLVSDVSGEEALGFRDYYENYIASNYNVTFTYTEQLEDAAAEKAAIEKFAGQGYNAVLSLSASDRATQIETCEENGIYYAVVSGMLDPEQYEQYKSYQYFVGEIGPSMDTEYEAGYAMGEYFAGEGIKTAAIYGAFIPNPMHVFRTAGVLAGLGCTYGGASDMDGIVGQIFADQGVDVSKIESKDVQIVGYLQGFGDTTFDELFAVLGNNPEAFISVGMATTFFADSLNQAGIRYSDIDSFTSGNATNMSEGTLEYLAGKYSSSIGPIFAATVDAVRGHAVRDPEGNAMSISQDYKVATDSETFEEIYNGDKGDNPIFNTTILDELMSDSATYDDFVAAVESVE